MTRRWCALLLMTVFCSAAAGQGAEAGVLKEEVTVTAPVVTAGDLFDGLPDAAASRVVATAPSPGRTLILDAKGLASIARAVGLAWQPDLSSTHATVHRASQRFDATALADAIQQALPPSALSASAKTSVRLDNMQTEMNAPVGEAVTLSILNLAVEPGGRRFSARARLTGDSARVLAETPVSGRILTTVTVPVLTRSVRPGEVIGAADIGWQDLEMIPGTEQFLSSERDILNRTPRRPVRAGVPLRAFDLAAPQAIKRGAVVTLIYEKDRLHISAQGRAMGDGAVGDTLRVVNLASSRTVEGIVEGPDVVRVGSPPSASPSLRDKDPVR